MNKPIESKLSVFESMRSKTFERIRSINLREGITYSEFRIDEDNSGETLEGLFFRNIPLTFFEKNILGLPVTIDIKVDILFPYSDSTQLLDDLEEFITIEDKPKRHALNYIANDVLLRAPNGLSINNRIKKRMNDRVRLHPGKNLLLILGHGGFGGRTHTKRILVQSDQENYILRNIDITKLLNDFPELIKLTNYSIVIDATCTYELPINMWDSDTLYLTSLYDSGNPTPALALEGRGAILIQKQIEERLKI